METGTDILRGSTMSRSYAPLTVGRVPPPPPKPLLALPLSSTGPPVSVAVRPPRAAMRATAVTAPTVCPLLMGGDYAPVHPGAHHHWGRAPRAAGIHRLRPDVDAGLGDRPAEPGAAENARAPAEARAGAAGASAGSGVDAAHPRRGAGATDGAATRRTRDPARPRASPRSARPVQAGAGGRQVLRILRRLRKLQLTHPDGSRVRGQHTRVVGAEPH